jgi:hypothetical protein
MDSPEETQLAFARDRLVSTTSFRRPSASSPSSRAPPSPLFPELHVLVLFPTSPAGDRLHATRSVPDTQVVCIRLYVFAAAKLRGEEEKRNRTGILAFCCII